jgi:hypothetical protein
MSKKHSIYSSLGPENPPGLFLRKEEIRNEVNVVS